MKPETLHAVLYPTTSLRIMRTVLEEHGMDWQPLLEEANIPVAFIDDVNAKVSGFQEIQFQQLFANATKSIPGLWLQTGLKYRLMSYGPLGLTVLASSTLERGLGVLESLQALTPSLMQYSLLREGGKLIGMMADDSHAPIALREFCQERALGSVSVFFNDMQPNSPVVNRVESTLDRPDNWLGCEQILGAKVIFNAPQTRWIFNSGVAELALPMASPLLEDTYQQLCEKLLNEAKTDNDLVGQLYGMLVRNARNKLTVTEAAEKLGITERTLYRRLQKHNMSFGSILDEVNAQKAKYLLDNTKLSIERIAEMFDFSETSSFSRAFKRWNGISPLKYRNQKDSGSETLLTQ